jgi:hypothetical protein
MKKVSKVFFSTALVLSFSFFVACTKEVDGNVTPNTSALMSNGGGGHTTTVIAASSASHDDDDVVIAAPPAAVAAGFARDFAGATAATWKLDDGIYYEVKFVWNGKRWEAKYTATGVLVQSKRKK